MLIELGTPCRGDFGEGPTVALENGIELGRANTIYERFAKDVEIYSIDESFLWPEKPPSSYRSRRRRQPSCAWLLIKASAAIHAAASL